MVDTLYQWYKKYGDACEEFSVGFVGSPEEHEALMTCLLALIQQEEPLRPLLVRLGQVAVAFVSRDGTVMKESNLKIEAVAWHEAAQPRRGVLPGITRSVGWKSARRLACRRTNVSSNPRRCGIPRAFSSPRARWHRAGDDAGRRTGRAVAPAGPGFARLPRNACQAVSPPLMVNHLD